MLWMLGGRVGESWMIEIMGEVPFSCINEILCCFRLLI